MGKAFRRLEKQVNDRVTATRRPFIPLDTRVRHCEVFLLELGAYLAVHVATNPDDASDANFIASYTDFKVSLESTVK